MKRSLTFQINLDLRAVALLSAVILLIGLMIAATSAEAGPRSGPQIAPTPNLDADMVDTHHAAASNASASQRANKVLWAGSNGRLAINAMPTGALDNRYLNDDQAETLAATVDDGILLLVDNYGSNGQGLAADGADVGVAGSGGKGVYGTSRTGYGVYAYGGDQAIGLYARSDNKHAGHFYNINASNGWSTLYAETNGPGWAIHAKSTHSTHNAGYFEGNLAQDPTYGGLVKAAVYVNSSGKCVRSFNPYATTTCYHSPGSGQYSIDFHFSLFDRFLVVTVKSSNDRHATWEYGSVFHTINVYTWNTSDGTLQDCSFMVVVF